MDARCATFFDLSDELFIMARKDGTIVSVNRIWRQLGFKDSDGQHLESVVDSRDRLELHRLLGLAPGQLCSQTLRLNLPDGRPTSFRIRAQCDDELVYISAREADGRRRMPTDQPAVADKLQSMGELAAGVAHEINTPIQFVANNLEFLDSAFASLIEAVEASRRITDTLGDAYPELTKRLLKRTHIELLATEVPGALRESIAGVERISEIVRAMNEFAHPQNDDRRLVDVHKIIRTAVSMTRSAWKYVAEVDLELADDLPLVPAFGGGLGQVVLNLIINAAHAIEEASPSGEKGQISIRTQGGTDHINVIVADTGCGIRSDIQDKIFDPFFTTKKAGKGTGQGLALAYREITERHGGFIDVVSAPGRGTEFHISLPLADSPQQAAREIAS